MQQRQPRKVVNTSRRNLLKPGHLLIIQMPKTGPEPAWLLGSRRFRSINKNRRGDFFYAWETVRFPAQKVGDFLGGDGGVHPSKKETRHIGRVNITMDARLREERPGSVRSGSSLAAGTV